MNTPSSLIATDARTAAEFAARTAYGRLLAYLVAQSGDIAAAEDALSEAFLTALRTWPSSGIPFSPEAWILTVARRKLTDAHRRERKSVALDTVILQAEQASEEVGASLPEHRLSLMLLCAHPIVDARVRTPLMLQNVLGVDVPTMASAFLVSPGALSKRLTRAKKKLAESGIDFHLPGRDALDTRLEYVLEAIYAAYFLGTSSSKVVDDSSDNLSQEALYLADLVARLQPDHAEAIGLLAVLAFCEGRRPAQKNSDDDFVPLGEQDCALWDARWVDAGHTLMMRAHELAAPGPYQTEAAIQAAHCSRLNTGFTPWKEIAKLYEALVLQSPTLQARVGRSVARFEATNDSREGFALLAECAREAEQYMPWWLAKAHILKKDGRHEEVRSALQRAMGLTSSPKTRRNIAKLIADSTFYEL